MDKLLINPSGLKHHEINFERQPNAVNTMCWYFSLSRDIHAVPPQEKQQSYYSEESFSWFTHSVLLLFWLNSFLLLVLCCLCNRWTSEGKPSLLSRRPALQELSHSRQAMNTGQDTCRLLQPSSQLGHRDQALTWDRHWPAPGNTLPPLHTVSARTSMHQRYFWTVLGYLNTWDISTWFNQCTALTSHTCSSSTGASYGMQGHHPR